jgi:hypothetical protein
VYVTAYTIILNYQFFIIYNYASMNKTIRFKKALLDKPRYCTDRYVLVSMNEAAQERARAKAERVAAANAAGNHGGPPDAPPAAPPVAPAAALPPAGQVVIGADAIAQIIAACQPPPHVAGAGAPLPERAGLTRLKAFSSTDAVEWMS